MWAQIIRVHGHAKASEMCGASARDAKSVDFIHVMLNSWTSKTIITAAAAAAAALSDESVRISLPRRCAATC